MEFQIDQNLFDEDGVPDESLVDAYSEQLFQLFANSPEGLEVVEQNGGLGWLHSMADYGLNYIGVAPPLMSASDLREIVFELIPRKVSCEPQCAGEIVRELRGFWAFVQREYGLSNAGECLDVLDEDAEKTLAEELADSSNYGMAKSFFMMGNELGYDMSSQEGMDKFMLAYNSTILNQHTAAGETTLRHDPAHSATRLTPAARKARRKALRAKQRKLQKHKSSRNRKRK